MFLDLFEIYKFVFGHFSFIWDILNIQRIWIYKMCEL